MNNGNLESLLVFLFIGLIAGWLAGILVKGRGFGVLGDILVGVIGAEIGGWIFGKLGLSAYGFSGAVIMALVGAVTLLAIIKLAVNVGSARTARAVLFLLAFCLPAHAATTVTVDSNEKVTVVQPGGHVQATGIPVDITRAAMAGDFEGRIVEIDYSRYQILVQDTEGRNREVLLKPEMTNNYRVGDYVLIRPTTDLTVVTLEENPRDFEGGIIRVDLPENLIVVQDTTGRERKVQMKQGMIATYKVDDYVRVHLMADLKEAKTVETVSGMRNLEGRIVSVDPARSLIVVRDGEEKDSAVIVRQGQISNYRVGDRVRIYLLADHEQVQVIRVIR